VAASTITSLVLTSINATDAVLTWVSATSPTSWNVYRCARTGASSWDVWEKLNASTITGSLRTFTDNAANSAVDPVAGTRYQWRVTGVTGGVESDQSIAIEGVFRGTITAPFSMLAIESAVKAWASAICGTTAPVIPEKEKGTRPSKPYVTYSMSGPGLDGQRDETRVIDGVITLVGTRSFRVNINVWGSDSVEIAAALQCGLMNNVALEPYLEGDISIGEITEAQDLSQASDTGWERRTQFAFDIFVPSEMVYDPSTIETVAGNVILSDNSIVEIEVEKP